MTNILVLRAWNIKDLFIEPFINVDSVECFNDVNNDKDEVVLMSRSCPCKCTCTCQCQCRCTILD